MKVRTHYSITNDARTVCGTPPSSVTDQRGEVSCRLCVRALERVEAKVEAERDKRGDRPTVDGLTGPTPLSSSERRIVDGSIAGEPVSSGPRWGSPDAAWEMLVLSQAERRSIASASRAERFFGIGGSGGTPTTPRETQEDLVEVEKARDLACKPMTIGDVDLTGEQVLAIAQARCVGHVVWKPGYMMGGTIVPGRGRHAAVEKVSAEGIAAETGLTKHQIGMVVRRVRASMAATLAHKGLARARPTEQRESEDEMAKVIGYDLSGWKDIASHLDRSESWCRERGERKDDPLPVKRIGREVVAIKAEVTTWYARQLRAA